MITAGLLLAAIGFADIARPLVRRDRRWMTLAAVAVLILVLGLCAGAPVSTVLALAGAAAWVRLVPLQGRSRAGFWPAVALALSVAASLALGEPRTEAGVLGAVWRLRSPVGPVSLDQAILILGVVVFLLASANAVVRVALIEERVLLRPSGGTDAAPLASPSALKGGRLIGPIERLIVLSLTLAVAYPLLAAFIAAKGIVRFPEISRDSDAGNRAEYFLIGSLVSWVQALAGAFAVWWSFGSSVG